MKNTMVGDNETGMVSPPKEASKFILQVRDENSGALMIGIPINQEDLDFLNVLIENDVFTIALTEKAMSDAIVKYQKKKRLDFEDAERARTRKEFFRRF